VSYPELQRFAALDPDSRASSIERSRRRIELEQSKLAAALIMHAVALIKTAFPTAEAIVFYLAVLPGDVASVQVAQVLDNAGGELEIAPDFWPAPDVIGEVVEALLAEASDLGADFQMAADEYRQRQLDIGDPLAGVRLLAEI